MTGAAQETTMKTSVHNRFEGLAIDVIIETTDNLSAHTIAELHKVAPNAYEKSVLFSEYRWKKLDADAKAELTMLAESATLNASPEPEPLKADKPGHVYTNAADAAIAAELDHFARVYTARETAAVAKLAEEFALTAAPAYKPAPAGYLKRGSLCQVCGKTHLSVQTYLKKHARKPFTTDKPGYPLPFLREHCKALGIPFAS